MAAKQQTTGRKEKESVQNRCWKFALLDEHKNKYCYYTSLFSKYFESVIEIYNILNIRRLCMCVSKIC